MDVLLLGVGSSLSEDLQKGLKANGFSYESHFQIENLDIIKKCRLVIYTPLLYEMNNYMHDVAFFAKVRFCKKLIFITRFAADGSVEIDNGAIFADCTYIYDRFYKTESDIIVHAVTILLKDD
jgi:hypothetical protein